MLQHAKKPYSSFYSNIEEHQRIESEYNEGDEASEAAPRIDLIVDLEAPHARHNLNKLLFRLYQDSPYLRIFVNKWQEWDDFSHKDNSAAPRATYYPGVFQVYLERKMIKSYNLYKERREAQKRGPRSRNSQMGQTHTSFVESETRESVEAQLEQFNSNRTNREIEGR